MPERSDGSLAWPRDISALAQTLARPLPGGSTPFLSDAYVRELIDPIAHSNSKADWMALIARLRDLGDGRSACMAYDIAIERTCADWPADLRAAAKILFRLKLDDDLIHRALAPIAAAQSDESVWTSVCTQLRGAGYVTSAEVLYRAALIRFPSSARLWGNFGVLYRNQGRFTDAIAAFEAALSLQPDYKIALHNLGSTYEFMKAFSVAAPIFQRVLDLHPDFAPSWNGLGTCLRQHDPAQAQICYERACALDPNDASAAFNLILLHAQQERTGTAIAQLALFLGRWPQDEAAKAVFAKLRKGQPVDPEAISEPDDQFRYAWRMPKNVDWSGPHPVEHGAAVSSSLQVLAPTPDMNRFALRPLDPVDWIETGLLPPRVERLLFAPQKLLDPPNSSFGFDQLQKMRSLVNAHLRAPPPPTARIFLSYQRDASLAEWMPRLRAELTARGYDVVFDEDLSADPGKVPHVVSLVAASTVFCPVLTDGYFERINAGDGRVGGLDYLDDGWAFDEFQLGMAMGLAKRLIIVGLWRSGALLPPFWPHNVLDMRDDANFSVALDRVFICKH